MDNIIGPRMLCVIEDIVWPRTDEINSNIESSSSFLRRQTQSYLHSPWSESSEHLLCSYLTKQSSVSF